MNYYIDVGVIGTGFVGKAVLKHFKGAAHYSLSGGDFKRVDKMPYIFLCLPTPFTPENGFDISALISNIEKLSPGKNIIIKSTVLPGTTEQLAREYPQHNFFMNPEFLRAESATNDFLHPDRQIVGYTGNHKMTAQIILDMLPKAEANFICEAREAEMVKLVGNDYLALKVVFANQVYDWCKKKGVDYGRVIEMVKHDPRIGVSHWEIFHSGYRGYSGYCFPKDMGASIFDSGSELLRKANELNDKYLQEVKPE